MEKIINFLGWVGMVSIQAATIPITIRALLGEAGTMPPLDMVFLVWFGLILYLIRAVKDKDKLYITSNGIGVFLNSILLFIIII